MQSNEVWTFDIPVGLFCLHHEVDRVCETLLQQGCDLKARFFRKTVSGVRELGSH